MSKHTAFFVFIRWLITFASLEVALAVLPGIRVEGNAWIAVAVMSSIHSLVNAFIKPFLTLLSCGCIVLTLGLFLLVVNALTILLSAAIANAVGIGFHVDGFWPAFWAGIVVSIVSFFLNQFVTDERRPPRGSPRPPRGSVGPRDDDIVM
jgi:putative membrane protein